jgi:Zn-finger nucleic acid-binding protein
LRVDADDHLIKAADFSLTSACPMNGLVTARSALRPQAGQIAVGGNRGKLHVGHEGWLVMCVGQTDTLPEPLFMSAQLLSSGAVGIRIHSHTGNSGRAHVLDIKEKFMDCPRCKSPLTQGNDDEQIAMRCNQCSGVMIKQRNLFKVIQKLSDDHILGNYTHGPTEASQHNEPVGSCPECSTTMEHYGYMENKNVMIDVCPSCNWLWADPQELARMTLTYIKAQRQYESMRVPQGVDGVGVAALEAAFLAGLGLGSIF